MRGTKEAAAVRTGKVETAAQQGRAEVQILGQQSQLLVSDGITHKVFLEKWETHGV